MPMVEAELPTTPRTVYHGHILPDFLYPELQALPVSDTTKSLDPSTSSVYVVRNPEGQIIAVAPAFVAVHADEWWIHEDVRGNPAVVRTLISGFLDMLQSQGLPYVFSNAPDEETADYLRRMGATEVGRLFLLPTKG